MYTYMKLLFKFISIFKKILININLSLHDWLACLEASERKCVFLGGGGGWVVGVHLKGL